MGCCVLEGQIYIGYRQGEKGSYTNLMLQQIKKWFSSNKDTKKSGNSAKQNGEKKGKDNWAKKQFEEMGKLRGKLILM